MSKLILITFYLLTRVALNIENNYGVPVILQVFIIIILVFAIIGIFTVLSNNNKKETKKRSKANSSQKYADNIYYNYVKPKVRLPAMEIEILKKLGYGVTNSGYIKYYPSHIDTSKYDLSMTSIKITRDESKIIQEEYNKAKTLREEAEEIKKKAKAEKEYADNLKKIAEAEMARIKQYVSTVNDEELNPYSVLGVHEHDSLDKITEVYRKLAQIYHPDKHQEASDFSNQQKSHLMAKINTSYEWIKNNH